jgi:hypothetical protein
MEGACFATGRARMKKHCSRGWPESGRAVRHPATIPPNSLISRRQALAHDVLGAGA